MIDIENSIKIISEDFKKNPTNFFTEGDLVSKFYNILKNDLNYFKVKSLSEYYLTK